MEGMDGFDALFEALKQSPSDALTLVMEIPQDNIQPGKSFSAEALEIVRNQLIVFVGARIMAAWEKREVPPTVATINLEVTVR